MNIPDVEITVHRYPDGSERRTRLIAGDQEAWPGSMVWSEPYTVTPSTDDAGGPSLERENRDLREALAKIEQCGCLGTAHLPLL